jgi:hypothetical protein
MKKFGGPCVECIGFTICAVDCDYNSQPCNFFRNAIEALKSAHNNARNEICPNFYIERMPVNESETHFERISCCRTSGKLSPVA